MRFSRLCRRDRSVLRRKKSLEELVLEFPVKSSGQHFKAVNSADAAVVAHSNLRPFQYVRLEAYDRFYAVLRFQITCHKREMPMELAKTNPASLLQRRDYVSSQREHDEMICVAMICQ